MSDPVHAHVYMCSSLVNCGPCLTLPDTVGRVSHCLTLWAVSHTAILVRQQQDNRAIKQNGKFVIWSSITG